MSCGNPAHELLCTDQPVTLPGIMGATPLSLFWIQDRSGVNNLCYLLRTHKYQHKQHSTQPISLVINYSSAVLVHTNVLHVDYFGIGSRESVCTYCFGIFITCTVL